ncbi:MAG: cytochrome P450 [Egibacteraceae bacterium]
MSLPQVVLGDGTRTWLVTRYQDVRRFLLDPRFSRSIASAALGPAGPASVMSVTEMDPPLHTRVRGLAADAFSVQGVERLRPRIQQVVNTLLDGLIAAGPPADLVARFCSPLTFAVQCELLGVPAAYRRAIRASSLVRFGPPGPTPEEARAAELALYASVTQAIEEKRRQPTLITGLFDHLIAARDRHGLIDEAELHWIATSFFRDGAFLTGIQIANSVLCLLGAPDHLRWLRQDAAQLGPAIEELLRLHPAVNHSMARVATVDVRLGGMVLHAGETVTAALPVANRDDAAFADPDRLDLARPINRHLSLGHGIHYCLGAPLTRVQVRVALATLLDRFPNLRLAVPADQLRRFAIQGARGVLNLPVSW